MPSVKEEEASSLSCVPKQSTVPIVDPALAMSIDVPILDEGIQPSDSTGYSIPLSPFSSSRSASANSFPENAPSVQMRSLNLEKFSKLYVLEKHLLSFRDRPRVEDYRIDGFDLSYILEFISQNRDMEDLFTVSDQIKSNSS
jgi:hypothetical protein